MINFIKTHFRKKKIDSFLKHLNCKYTIDFVDGKYICIVEGDVEVYSKNCKFPDVLTCNSFVSSSKYVPDELYVKNTCIINSTKLKVLPSKLYVGSFEEPGHLSLIDNVKTFSKDYQLFCDMISINSIRNHVPYIQTTKNGLPDLFLNINKTLGVGDSNIRIKYDVTEHCREIFALKNGTKYYICSAGNGFVWTYEELEYWLNDQYTNDYDLEFKINFLNKAKECLIELEIYNLQQEAYQTYNEYVWTDSEILFTEWNNISNRLAHLHKEYQVLTGHGYME